MKERGGRKRLERRKEWRFKEFRLKDMETFTKRGES
jgi:hypothetical protein